MLFLWYCVFGLIRILVLRRLFMAKVCVCRFMIYICLWLDVQLFADMLTIALFHVCHLVRAVQQLFVVVVNLF